MEDKDLYSLGRDDLIQFAMLMDGTYDSNWHHELIADHLIELERRVREGYTKTTFLLIEMGPRSGKSRLCSQFFPAWFLGKNPEKHIICASYSATLAENFSEITRDMMNEGQYKQMFTTTLKADSQSKAHWQTNKKGSFRAAGVGGATTGFGAHCFPAGTKITTDQGSVNIEELVKYKDINILTYGNGTTHWRRPKAIKRDKRPGIYRVTTTAGRVVEATGDHPFFSGGGYKEAAKLSKGDSLLCLLPEELCETSLRGIKTPEEKSEGFLLLQDMSLSCPKPEEVDRGRGSEACKDMSLLQGRIQIKESLLLQDLLEKIYKTEARLDMLYLRELFPAEVLGEAKKDAVLQLQMFVQSPLYPNDGRWKSEVEGWCRREKKKEPYLLQNKKDCLGKGWLQMCGMRPESPPKCTSCRRRPHKQCRGESGGDVSHTPCPMAQCGTKKTVSDTVAMVERICEDEATVYNLQVEKEHNFFANEILVHNCMVIDDSCANRESAESKTQRDMVYGWFCSTALTRLEPHGVVIMIQTRWHIDDLLGRFLDQNEGRDDIDIIRISFPAIAEEDEKYRKKGEVLWPNRYSLENMLALKKTLPARDWAALYQQDPIKSMGNVFNAVNFRDFALSDLEILKGNDKPMIDRRNLKTMIFVDPAFSTRTGSDDTAIAVVGWDKVNKKAYILDGFADTCLPSEAHEVVINMADKWDSNGYGIQGIVVEENNINKDQMLFLTELKRKMKDQGKFYKMKGYRPQGKKEDRINFTLQPAFEMNAIYWRGDNPGNPFWEKLKEQLVKFPGAHDDTVDVICMAVSYFKNKESGSSTSSLRSRQEVRRMPVRNPLTGEDM